MAMQQQKVVQKIAITVQKLRAHLDLIMKCRNTGQHFRKGIFPQDSLREKEAADKEGKIHKFNIFCVKKYVFLSFSSLLFFMAKTCQ